MDAEFSLSFQLVIFGEVLKVCHYVYSIKLGKIAYSGKPELIINDKEKLKELFL
jgi:ABC-type lipopolysaccharide export system ATPase subunit